MLEPRTILIVEDSQTQAMTLRHLLEEEGYSVVTAANGQEGIDAAGVYLPDLIISDVVMPVMGGNEMCEVLKAVETTRDIPVMLLSSLSSPEDIVRGISARADYYLSKPYREGHMRAKIQAIFDRSAHLGFEETPHGLMMDYNGKQHMITADRRHILGLLLSIYENAVEKNRELRETQEALQRLNDQLEEKVRKRTASLRSEISERLKTEASLQRSYRQLRDALKGTIRATALTVETRDPYTAGHQRRVADLAMAIGGALGLPADKIEGIRMAGIIHDLGKIAVPAEILTKPTRLSDVEFRIIQSHAQAGYDILKDIDFPWPIADIVLQHHEKMDSSGYPQCLSGENILIEARILGVADVVEAIAADRPYRPALGVKAALKEITQNQSPAFDSSVVDACVRVVEDGTFSFENGEAGVLE